METDRAQPHDLDFSTGKGKRARMSKEPVCNSGSAGQSDGSYGAVAFGI